MKLKKYLNLLNRNNSAVLAANFYNLETLKGILTGAKKTGKAVILQVSPGSIEYMGLRPAVEMFRAMVSEYEVEAWIHLDHASDLSLIDKCLEAGFDSVMIDASEKDIGENIAVSREVVRRARHYGACVEAELGYVAKLGQEQAERGYTRPEEAERFVRETGVDALAVAIGSAHGFYKHTPRLDIELLKKIRERIPGTALVLHGSSGIPGRTLKEAVNAGIRKVNLATEIKATFMNVLSGILQKSEEIDLRKVFPVAMEKVAELVQSKIELISS